MSATTQTRKCTLESQLAGLDDGLIKVLTAVASAVAQVADTLRTASTSETGTSNELGDKQLVADVAADKCVFDALRACGAVAVASSEEQPHDVDLGGGGGGGGQQAYSVAWDPLDGSSIIGANWAVGSIFGIWPGRGFVGRAACEQAAAAYAVYGPRTLLVLARPAVGGEARRVVQEFVLLPSGTWQLSRADMRVPASKKCFAAANLRACADNAAYQALVLAWLGERYTLRYSGGLVPDVHHILVKGGGVFCNPVSPSAGPKLRCLYETFPLALIVEAAGGASHDGRGSVLEARLESHDQRAPLCAGSTAEVAKCMAAMQAAA